VTFLVAASPRHTKQQDQEEESLFLKTTMIMGEQEDPRASASTPSHAGDILAPPLVPPSRNDNKKNINNVDDADVGILSPSGSPVVLLTTGTGGSGSRNSRLGGNTIVTAAAGSAPLSSSFSLLQQSSSPCTAGYVECENGYVKNSDPQVTCASECGSNCCVGSYACWKFTGKVCKDGNSCNGKVACSEATIYSVVNSCIGYQACIRAGFDGGKIGKMVKFARGGQVGDVVDSCIGKYSCKFAAYRGSVGNITMSCAATYGCYSVAMQGTAGNIVNSCNDDKACSMLARYGDVGDIQDSCVGKFSCFQGAASGGMIGDIMMSCNYETACYQAGKNAAGAITSNVKNCCNTAAEVCKYATEATLPADCRDVSTVKDLFLWHLYYVSDSHMTNS